MSQKYEFVRVRDGKRISVDFETMMEADAAGYLKRRDGEYRRDRSGEGPLRRSIQHGPPLACRLDTFSKPIVSDTLGFPSADVLQWEADRLNHGFNGVEFKPDPKVPEVTQVHFSDRGEWRRYMEHRGYFDKNGRTTSAVLLSAADMERAIRLAERVTAKAF